MIGVAIGDSLPTALGIAISPIPVVAVILMLFSAKARLNGPAFILGWIVGVAVVTTIAVVAGGADSGERPDDWTFWAKIVLGLGLLFVGYRNWQGRPAEGVTPEMPGWMKVIDTFTPVKALGMAVLLSAINPKNLLLALAGGAAIGAAGLNAGESAIAIAVFTLVASATIIGPVVYYFAGGQTAQRTLDGMKDWLQEHNAIVMAVLLLVIGVKLVGDGISGLSA